MAIGDISLGSSTRENLLALQRTTKQLDITQSRLTTGKKINSSLDGAAAYFASLGFLNTANDLSNLKDGISTAVQTVKAATDGIDSITSLVEQMQGLTNSALQTSDAGTLTSLATQYNSLRTQIDYLVTDSTFNGINLLNSTSTSLSVAFNPSNTTSLSIQGVDVRAAGLGIATAANAWATSNDVLGAQSILQTALATLRSNATTFGNNNTVLTTRQTFTDNLITTLNTAADNLVLADTNEEGAKMQALQAQSQLGVIALSVSGEKAQDILKLF